VRGGAKATPRLSLRKFQPALLKAIKEAHVKKHISRKSTVDWLSDKVDRKILIGGAVAVIVVVVVAVTMFIFLNQPPSPLFTVTGKQQHTTSVGGGYEVISWNFTFAYKGASALQNVNLYLNNGNMPFKTVPEVTKGWTNEYIWTPGDVNANVTITISWQGGTEYYEFQP
jgi:hypothetical protein